MIEGAPQAIGMIYAIVAVILLAVLFITGRFNRKIGYIFLGVSTILGFLVFAPMLPIQMQVLLMGQARQLGVPIAMAVLVLVVFVVITFILGRVFCGYVCPIGAVQELVYRIRTKKLMIKNKAVLLGFRLFFLLAFVILAIVFSVGLLNYIGVREFFHLELSGYFFVFLAVVIISVFIYRPFCRILCPYGAILSLVAGKSRFGMKRSDKCIVCETCEDVCPTGEAGVDDWKQECYLCDRCRDACPHNAIEYTRRS